MTNFHFISTGWIGFFLNDKINKLIFKNMHFYNNTETKLNKQTRRNKMYTNCAKEKNVDVKPFKNVTLFTRPFRKITFKQC